MEQHTRRSGVLAASCLLALGACATPSEPKPTPASPDDSPWQTVSQLGVTFQVPASWQAGYPPGSDWCAGENPPTAAGLITPSVGAIRLGIGCGPMPSEYQVPHVKVEISQPAAGLADQLGGENWEQTPATKREHLPAKPAIGADEGIQEVAEEYSRYRERYGPVTITVLLPKDADDSDLAAQILDRAGPATTATHGCPMVVANGNGSDIRDASNEALTVCHYVSIAAFSEPENELSEQRQYPALLLGERQLTPAQQGQWIAALRTAENATPVHIPPAEAGGWEPNFIQVRSAGGGLATVRYDGVGALGVRTADTVLPLIQKTCQPLFGGLVPLISGSETTVELCASDRDADQSDR